MKLPHSCFDPFNHVTFPNCRDTRYLGAAIVVGNGLNARAHMNANAGNELTPDDFVWKPDPEKKAKEFEVDMVVANTGRIWTFDHGECQYGYGWDFNGAKMGHLGQMVAKDLIAHFHGDPYVPTLLTRLTKWTWDAGKEVYLLREPNGTVWVMQEYTRDVDPSLTIANLKNIGPKLTKLPKGWTFETKVLEKDLVADTTKSDGWASIIRDDLHCTYQAMGYDTDTSANYIP
ncbi:hypothetical protein [Rhizobium leguminosarum]|uniref:hypothetical protein n=1 Tax=Rhizobium leguminosarum TaxID=384 RepID=UPI001C97F235|nr:hypothetical protein [Rhizobium leguminosarum]MBY5427475.1 hypothetical protein [Rhizobium leguminosarum]